MGRPRDTAVDQARDVASWQGPFRFTGDTRPKLIRILGVLVVDVQTTVTFLEITAGSYLLARPASALMPRNLRALRTSVHDVVSRLSSLDQDVTDAVLDGLSIRGYQPDFISKLKEGLHLLHGAIDHAEAELPPAPRPPELLRGWLARQIRMTLQDEGGIDVTSRKGARALGECLRIILKAVGEPVPSDVRPLLNEARRP